MTFLFTDIEGSTRLWEQHPEAMGRALARHDALLEAAIEQQGGTAVRSRGEGDSFFDVFPRAADAVIAALRIQQTLQATLWPPPVALRVRVALHTGTAELRDGDYYGSAVNRCARLRAIAHGGQVLLSGVTERLVREDLPPLISLKNLGSHQLRDLQNPEEVYQLLHPDLPADFPPLPSPGANRHNLHEGLTTFFGREKEIGEVQELLSQTRLLTLAGAGGTGKTRLSLQVALGLLGVYSDGVWLVELAPLADPDLVPQLVATARHIKEEPGRTLSQTLVECLRPKQLLILLDNCEHVVSACAHLVNDLLRHCPALRILATSRESLGVSGEQTYRVPSLSVPDLDRLPSPDGLRQYEAVQLFVDRARLSQPSFTLTGQNAAAVACLCCRLDGIPLALELAAVRVKSMTVEQLSQRLDDRFRLLDGGNRTALPRHQTLRALIDWSYDHLHVPERTLLRRLSVFAGGWTLESAEAVCSGAGIEPSQVLDLLTKLVEKSLVHFEPGVGESRYRVLETVRQYGRERLEESGETQAVCALHAEHFCRLAEVAGPKLRGIGQPNWMERLEVEHDNLRVALEWSLKHEAGGDKGVRAAAAVWFFWLVRGHLTDGRNWVELALGRDESASPILRARLLNGLGFLSFYQGDYDRTTTVCTESLALAQEGQNDQEVALALSLLSTIIYNVDMDLERAAELCWKSRTISERNGDLWNLTFATNNLGYILMNQGDLEQAASVQQESLTLAHEIGEHLGVAYSLLGLSDISLRQGNPEQSRIYVQESIRVFVAVGERRGLANSLMLMARTAQAEQQHRKAALLFGAEESLRETLGAPVDPIDRPYRDHSFAITRATLGEAAFEAAWAEGRAMTLEQALAFAQEANPDG